MKIVKIHSRNAEYQRLIVLKTNRVKRNRYGQFFVEGVRNINEAVKNKWQIVSFIYSEGESLSDWAQGMLDKVETEVNYVLPLELLAEISSKSDASELLAVVRMRKNKLDPEALNERTRLLLFDRPSNKGNLGTVIRSCDSFGADGLIMTGHAVDLYDPEVIAASMGSFFSVPFFRVSELNEVYAFISAARDKLPSFKTVGTTARNEMSLQEVDLTTPFILMVGNETDGLSRAFKEYCDVLATIPMASSSSASSLNVACAATVMLYEAARQRG